MVQDDSPDKGNELLKKSHQKIFFFREEKIFRKKSENIFSQNLKIQLKKFNFLKKNEDFFVRQEKMNIF